MLGLIAIELCFHLLAEPTAPIILQIRKLIDLKLVLSLRPFQRFHCVHVHLIPAHALQARLHQHKATSLGLSCHLSLLDATGWPSLLRHLQVYLDVLFLLLQGVRPLTFGFIIQKVILDGCGSRHILHPHIELSR